MSYFLLVTCWSFLYPLVLIFRCLLHGWIQVEKDLLRMRLETLPSCSPKTIIRGTFACTIGSYTVAHTQAAVQIMNIFKKSTHFAATSSVAWLQRYSRPLPHRRPSRIPFLFYLSLCLRGDASLPAWLFQGPPWPSRVGMMTFLSMCKPMHVDLLLYIQLIYTSDALHRKFGSLAGTIGLFETPLCRQRPGCEHQSQTATQIPCW